MYAYSCLYSYSYSYLCSFSSQCNPAGAIRREVVLDSQSTCPCLKMIRDGTKKPTGKHTDTIAFPLPAGQRQCHALRISAPNPAKRKSGTATYGHTSVEGQEMYEKRKQLKKDRKQ